MNPEYYLKQLFNLPQDRALTIKQDGAAWLRCINPEHSGGHEKTPSAKINLADGSPYLGRYYCFSCGMSLRWNDFADRMCLDKVDDKYEGIRHRKLGFKRNSEPKIKHNKSTFLWPEHKEWRQIPGWVVKKMGGYVHNTKDVLTEPILIIPVTMYGEEVGHIRALLHDPKRDKRGKKLEKSYVNSTGDWVQHSFLGYDLAAEMQGLPLWIGEGPRDYARGLQCDLRTVGLLGSKFGEERAELIRLLNPPCIICGTDNDKAGNKVAQDILDHCGDFVPVIRARWSEDEDMFQQSKVKLIKMNQKAIDKYCNRKKRA